MSGYPPLFPFTAVVGHDELKLSLLLSAVDPQISGVLLRGQKGSGKTTLARGLAALLPGQAPFVELPVGATEDRLLGTIDLAAVLTGGQRRFQPGLLADAHGGVLYVDEVNLLPDHLVDVLLDVAASGVNRVEREGISHSHPSRFVLIGSMNPEEGELRPQLLDRFGLAVEVVTPNDPPERAEAVRRRLAFDADPNRFADAWRPQEEALAARLSVAKPGAFPDHLFEVVARLCASVGAEGLRADLVICRASSALAGLEGREEAGPGDVARVAPLALAHRRRRSPFEDPGIGSEELDQALAEALDDKSEPRKAPKESFGEVSPAEQSDSGQSGARPGPARDRVAAPGAPTPVLALRAQPGRSSSVPDVAAGGRRTTVEGARGRLVADRAPVTGSSPSSLALAATAGAAAARRVADPSGPVLAPDDLREAVRERRAANLIVLAVDASGSMGAERRMEAAKTAVLSLLLDAYQRRDRVALVTFRGESAEVVLRPTSSVEVARARLSLLPTGGRTPLAAGIEAALGVAESVGASPPYRPLLVLVSDGRATAASGGADPLQAAQAAAARVRGRGVSAVVVDAEEGATRLGLARELAQAMGARYLTLNELSAGALEQALRGLAC